MRLLCSNIIVCCAIAISHVTIADDQHWSFEAPETPSLPAVKDASWAKQPTDLFILKRLEALELSPSARADKATLLRRVWLDLLGIPPSQQALTAFLQDTSEQAYLRMIDALLASPHYGEKWGRHWLDVSRYGDSNGGDENHPYPHAFRYRNWIIDAFNQDMAYDQFVQAQLAGDLVSWGDEHTLAGTGFLAIGTKILAEQDPVKKRADIIDEQLDTLGRAFMGLSIGCARCHDHKFDPISEKDYYALAGIFYSTDIEDREVKTPKGVLQKSIWQRKIKDLDQRISKAEIQLSNYGNIGQTREWQAEDFDRGNVIVDREQYGKEIGIIGDPGAQDNFVEYDLSVKDENISILELRYAAKTARPGKILLDGNPIFENAVSATTGGWFPENQKWIIEGILELKSGEHVLRIESKPLMSHIDRIRLISVSNPKEALASIEQIKRFTKERETLASNQPEQPKVMGVSDGSIQNVRLNIRGNPHQLGEEIQRRFPLEIGKFKHPIVDADSSGRLELAKWISSRHHPLTARVFVNRVWHWHFDRGLVDTPDNFGTTGQAPSHPELLDWLTTDFIRHGWSIKHLHRRILLSSVYQLSSMSLNQAAEKKDPSNRLYWKKNMRRMDAETFRDALLAVSGSLNANAHLKKPIYVKAQDPSSEDLDKNRIAYESFPHRTVYLPVVRSHIYDLLALLDFPNATAPIGKRSLTTVPTQALMMFNSPFVKEMAKQTNRRVLHSSKANASRLDELYRILFSRHPSEKEMTACLELVSKTSELLEEAEAWETLCHVLMISNDFIYVQ
tara:strand:+ start:976 stop:3348 length:2373 start_codon:yes stop_codon:yes gene_type:complete